MTFKKLFVLFLVMFALFGCTGKAKIKIFNNTDSNDIWYVVNEDEQTMIDSFQTVELEYDVTGYLLFSDTKKVEIEYGGEYVITKNEKFNLASGDSKNIEIITDAGRMIIQNGSFDRHINEVYIVESGEDFEVNLLSSPIDPWDDRIFNLKSGFWDLKLVDNTNEILLERDIFISLEASWTYLYE